MQIKLYTYLVLSVMLFSSTSYAADTRFELDEIIVSGNFYTQTVENLPRSTAIITAEDIRNSASNNVAELLSREANVNFKTTSGNEKFSKIDIRGMGDTSVSNVLILVDGIRLNTADLAAPDLSSIPLSQIQRIEIIRGASAVRYGNGAVGGVINIITDISADTNSYGTHAEYKSFNTQDYRLYANQAFEHFSLQTNIAYSDTEGYRETGKLEKENAKLAIRYYPHEQITINSSISIHRDEYGFTDPVDKIKFTGSDADRRSSDSHPQDKGSTDDTRFTLGSEFDLDQSGIFSISTTVRDRKNPFIQKYNENITLENQQKKINEDSIHVDLLHEFSLHTHKLNWGISIYKAELLRSENGNNVIDSSLKHFTDVDEQSFFIQGEFQLNPKFFLNTGYRANVFTTNQKQETFTRTTIDHTETNFIELFDPFGNLIGVISEDLTIIDAVIDEFTLQHAINKKWYNNAIDLGLVYYHSPHTNYYVSLSSSYRNPNGDELVESSDTLRPQTGYHFDMGMRFKLPEKLESSLNFFHILTKDEIFYGENNGRGENFNLEQRTRRYGSEFDIKYYPQNTVFLWGAIGYTQARLKNTQKSIPLVPELTASIGTEWNINPALTLIINGNYIDNQFDGNDLSNSRFEKLESYTVFNSKMIYSIKNIELFFGINNLSDEVYATNKYSDNYYPMPSRNYYAGLSAQF